MDGMLSDKVMYSLDYLGNNVPLPMPSVYSSTITSNGIYTPAEGYGFDQVTISVPWVISAVQPRAYFSSTITTFTDANVDCILDNAFYFCKSLTSVDVAKCKYVCAYAFNCCYKLSYISLPNCECIGQSAFEFCSSLTTISLPKCSYIGNSAFTYADLYSIYLTGSSFVTFHGQSETFSGNAGGFEHYATIYVPASLYTKYINDSWWKTLSTYIVSV